MYVGPQGEPGEEQFQLTGCTPSARAEQLEQRPFFSWAGTGTSSPTWRRR
ncbi:hypothetical protein ACIBK9_00370 [Nonomuraea sp. NPDC050227]